jgi:2-polyprenyl-3-methyl-5-hydroxy-6-metoxy-1,4-benzoquinol methylase
MGSIIDDRGFNQGFVLTKSTHVRMSRRADWMINKMDLSKDADILEIGCGTGEIAFWIAEKTGKRVIGTDLCVPFIEGAKKNYVLDNLKYDVLDFNKIDHFKEQRFDYIIGNGILHHLYYHLDTALANLRLLLKEGGTIIFMEPNIYNPYCALIFNIPILRKKANLEPDEMAFSASFIKKKLAQAGFASTKVEYLDFLLPGIPDVLIKPSIQIGNIIEKIPVVKMTAQSIFIESKK